MNLDPLKRIYSQGWLYRKSASDRIPTIVFLGMWLIFGTSLAAFVFNLTGIGFSDAIFGNKWISFNLPFAILCAAILCRVTRNYLRWRRKDRVDN